MKKGIHPKVIESKVVCACGHSFVTSSMKPLLRVEICSNCHPFFTGTQRIVDTAGQVERFMRRLGRATAAGVGAAEKPAAAEPEKTAEAVAEEKADSD